MDAVSVVCKYCEDAEGLMHNAAQMKLRKMRLAQTKCLLTMASAQPFLLLQLQLSRDFTMISIILFNSVVEVQLRSFR